MMLVDTSVDHIDPDVQLRFRQYVEQSPHAQQLFMLTYACDEMQLWTGCML